MIGSRVEKLDHSMKGTITGVPAPNFWSVLWDDGTSGAVHPLDVYLLKMKTEEGLAPGWVQYQCRGCGQTSSALKDSLCGYYQVCETCARKKPLGSDNMLPPGQVWLKEGSPGSGRYA